VPGARSTRHDTGERVTATFWAKSSTEIFHLLMVNVLREFIAHCGANFVVALALKIVLQNREDRAPFRDPRR
jgi:hypothetical protein